MNLYLIQHGTATSKDEDPDRPLTEAGEDETNRMALYLSLHTDVRPHKIFHSGKLRARQTAEILAEALNPGGGVEAADGLSPSDDPNAWADKLKDKKNDLMLVGHLPYLSRLTSLLITEDPDKFVVNFRNSGVVCLYRIENAFWCVNWVLLPELVG
ncbi:phosphohistidine phosphatase SixA [bacterium]|nr:phosphohistidine phosphatase SixA [bacterium]MBU1653164.1 phosphohistidine phosphatase SixA [bacterium]